MPKYIFMEFKFKLKTIKIKKLHSTKYASLGVGYTQPHLLWLHSLFKSTLNSDKNLKTSLSIPIKLLITIFHERTVLLKTLNAVSLFFRNVSHFRDGIYNGAFK